MLVNVGRLALWISLLSVSGIGFVTARRLMAKVGNWETASHLTFADWKQFELKDSLASQLVNIMRQEVAWRVLERTERQKIGVLMNDDPDYPALLREIHFPPVALFYRGERIKANVGVAIVGTRQATSYGLKVAHDLAQFLASYPVSVISGLASGIDTAAHHSTVNHHGYTVAVLGSGINHIYPAHNLGLTRRILASGGTILSEYLPDTPPHKAFFPIRNRIISGMAKAVVIVEAGQRSGALITAAHAVLENRDVYAVPGSIYSAASKGVHELLLDGAEPLYVFRHLVENLQLTKLIQKTDGFQRESSCQGSVLEELIIAELSSRLKSLTELHTVLKSHISMKALAMFLAELELAGKVFRKPDGRYGVF